MINLVPFSPLSFKDISFSIDSRQPGVYLWFSIFNHLYFFHIGGIKVNPLHLYPFTLNTSNGFAIIFSFNKSIVIGEMYGSI